jgi:uncharacterized membrane protein YecN with MAPEG domain
VSFTTPQRHVALGAATGVAITIAALGVVALMHPFASVFSMSTGRVQVVALSVLAPALALAVSIARLATHRFRTPQDIDGSGLTSGTDQAKLLQALLQNTLEQLALALPVYVAWGALAPAHLVEVVLMAALLFLLGRVLFFWGYRRGAPGRALGFALTFYPTVFLLVSTIVMIVLGFLNL